MRPKYYPAAKNGRLEGIAVIWEAIGVQNKSSNYQGWAAAHASRILLQSNKNLVLYHNLYHKFLPQF
jgi:hypothetical protein